MNTVKISLMFIAYVAIILYEEIKNLIRGKNA